MWGSKQVAEFVGVGYPTLDHWIRSDLLSCLCPSDGTGNRRSWSAADVTRAIVVKELRQRGRSLQAIRKSRILDRLTDEAIDNEISIFVTDQKINIVPIRNPDPISVTEIYESVKCQMEETVLPMMK